MKERTELLRPGGIGRVVTQSSAVEELVGLGFIFIEESDLPQTHAPAELGVKAKEKKAPRNPKKSKTPEAPTNVATSKDVNALVAIAAISDIEDSETLNAFIADETRSTVLHAAEKWWEANPNANAV